MENQNHKLVRNYLIFTFLIWVIHICLGCFFLPSVAVANNESENLRKAKEWGQAKAATAQGQLNNYMTMDNNQLKALVGYEGNVKGAGMSLEEAESLGMNNMEKVSDGTSATQCGRDNCPTGAVFGIKATVKRQEKLEEAGFVKNADDMPISNKGFLDAGLKQIKNAKNGFDYLSGSYVDCNLDQETYTQTSEDTCDQYYSSKVSSCFPEQIVEIDPKFNYSCNKKRAVKTKTCIEKITSISCKSSQECDMGGIERGTVESDMKFEYSNGVLNIGTIADNYWPGNCGVYDRTTSFKIKYKERIKEFFLFKVGFDDYMQIILNDHLIYVGPDGGNKLEVREIGNWRRKVVNNGVSNNSCERGVSWEKNPNIDLRPYLKEGENILKTRVIVGGVGEGWLQIRAKQNCCSHWDIKREELCEYF